MEIVSGEIRKFLQGLIHRDIKPENLLLNKKGKFITAIILLASFQMKSRLQILVGVFCIKLVYLRIGKCHSLDSMFTISLYWSRRETICGTLDYLPPEMIIQQETGHDHNVDIWSLGVLLYEFLVTSYNCWKLKFHLI